MDNDDTRAVSVTYRKKQNGQVQREETGKNNCQTNEKEAVIHLETSTKTTRWKKNHKNGRKYNKTSIAITFLVIISFLLLCTTITESFIIGIYDFAFYRQCHTDLVVIISWMLTEILLLLDLIFVQWPQIVSYAKRMDGWNTRNVGLGSKLRKIFSNIINWIARISLFYLPAVITYLIGVGQGRWNIIGKGN